MRGTGASGRVSARREDGAVMGGRKKIGVLVVAAAACLATLLLLLRDWNGEVARLAAQFERDTGLKVSLGGSSRLTLLPPALSVDNIGLSQDETPFAQIQRLSLRVSPLSLLTGQVQVAAVVFDHARLGGVTVDGLEVQLGDKRIDGFSKWNGHAITFAAHVAADKTAQMRLTVPTLNTALRFEGSLESGPSLSGHLTLNAGNLAGLLPGLSLPAGRSLQAEADLDWGDGQFSLVNLSLESGDSRAGGSVMVLAGSPSLIDADLDIDSLDVASWHAPKSTALPNLLPAALTPPANGAPKATKASAENVQTPAAFPSLPDTVLANLRLNVGRLIWHGQTLENLDIRAGLDQGNLVIRHAGLQWGKDLRADLDGVLEKAAFAGRLRLNGPGLSGRSDLSASPQELRLTNLLAKHDDLLIKGSLTGNWQDGLAAQWSGSIGTWADTAVSAKLTTLDGKLEIPEIEARIGALSVRGQVSADLTSPRPLIQAQLRAGDIDLASLPGSPRPAFVAPQPKLGGKAARQARATSSVQTAAKKGGSPFTNAPVDWSALNILDGRFDLAANSLSGGFGRLEQPRLTLALAQGTATIEDLQAGYLDGQVNAKGRLGAHPLPSLDIQAQIKGAELSRLKPGFAGLRLGSGRADARLHLKASGRSSRDMATSAVGDGRLDARDGSVEGIDLAAINGQMSNLRNIGNILALAQSGLKGGKTQFQTLTGSLKVAGGIAQSPDLTLKAEGGTLAADLSVALVPWTTDSSLSLALAALPATPVVLRLNGPADNPRTVVDANALQKALVQSGLGRALGGEETTPGDSGEAKGGRKILQNIFKALGR